MLWRLTSSCMQSKTGASAGETISGDEGFFIAHARVSMYTSGCIPIASHSRSLVSMLTEIR